MTHNPADWPPSPGLFKLRYRKGGPWVPAEIVFGPPREPAEPGHELDRAPRFWLWLDGRYIDDNDLLHRVWQYGRPIERAEYDYLCAVGAHARSYSTRAPEANPDRRADLNRMKPLF